MSKIALYPSPSTGEITLAHAKNCCREDFALAFMCPSCGATLRLRGGGQISQHFYGRHFPDCDIAQFQRDTLVIQNGVAVNLEAICSHEDQPYNPKGAGPAPGPGPSPGPGPGPKPKPSEIEKKNIAYAAKSLGNAKALKNHLWRMPLNLAINLSGTLTVGDLVLRGDNLVALRRKGIDGEFRLVIAHRIPPEKVPPSIRKEGYIVFRDALSASDEDAFYFLVRLNEPTQHEHFFDLVAGPLWIRDPHKYIVLLGKWERLPNCSYNAYFATINSDCYFFTNNK